MLTDKAEVDKLRTENAELKVKTAKAEKENAAIKAYLCGKDTTASFCK